MIITVLQHVLFEGPGAILEWAALRGHEVRSYLVSESGLPQHASDLLVVMGGPMSVNDAADIAWLDEEIRWVGEHVRKGTPVLGICLGAQIIARALGAGVHSNAHREIGWFELRSADQFRDMFPQSFTAFHWHGETFELPPGAELLLSSTACANQAFRIRNAVGLQFHLEMTGDGLAQLMAHCADELIAGGPWIMSSDAITAGAARYGERCRDILFSLLDKLVSGVS